MSIEALNAAVISEIVRHKEYGDFIMLNLKNDTNLCYCMKEKQFMNEVLMKTSPAGLAIWDDFACLLRR